MSADLFQMIPEDRQLLEVAQRAQAAGMHLIHNGRRLVVSPTIPPGWWRVAIGIKPPREAA